MWPEHITMSSQIKNNQCSALWGEHSMYSTWSERSSIALLSPLSQTQWPKPSFASGHLHCLWSCWGFSSAGLLKGGTTHPCRNNITHTHIRGKTNRKIFSQHLVVIQPNVDKHFIVCPSTSPSPSPSSSSSSTTVLQNRGHSERCSHLWWVHSNESHSTFRWCCCLSAC